MSKKPPNILFIMSDQFRADCLGASGNRVIQTPRLDALAGQSVNAANYHANAPVCVPARCCTFTGRYPHAHQVRENYTRLEQGREVHLFRALKQGGYRLGYVGKNHLLEPGELVNFDYTDIWGHDHQSSAVEENVNALARERSQRMVEVGAWAGAAFHDLPEEGTRSFQQAQSAITFIERADGDEPFCLTLSFEDPHAPHIAPRRFEAMYPLDRLELYPCRSQELSEKARRYGIKHRALQADRAGEEDRRRYMAVYYAMISWVDEQVGRVLDALERRGLRDDTIVVFTADHGEFCFEHGMVKKDLVLLDSLLRIPLLISWPQAIKPQRIDDTLIEQVDLMPTLLDLAGQAIPFGVQGRSFRSLLQGDKSVHKEAVFAEVCPPWLHLPFADFEAFKEDWETRHGSHFPFNIPGDYTKSIRDHRGRYVWYHSGEEELYDHDADPNEQHNVASDPAYTARKVEMKLGLFEWLAQSEDPLSPITRRALHEQYDAWENKQVIPGGTQGPEWMRQRFMR